MTDINTATARLYKAVADLLASRNNNLYAVTGIYEGEGRVTIGSSVMPAYSSIDAPLFKGKEVVCIFFLRTKK